MLPGAKLSAFIGQFGALERSDLEDEDQEINRFTMRSKSAVHKSDEK